MKLGGFSDYKVFTANSHPALAEEISAIMGRPLGKATVNKFSDGEISISIGETVRGVDCYIVQSTCNPVNDNLMELLIMIDAMKRLRICKTGQKSKGKRSDYSKACSKHSCSSRC